MTKALGVQTRAFSGTQGLFSTTLWVMANKLPPTDRVKPKPDAKKVRAAATSAKNKKLDLSDEQVIEARRQHEEDGRSTRELAAQYGVPVSRMRQILEYQTRTFGMP